jgi:hypothetical protein
MGRRNKLRGKTKEYFEKADKGRKKEWQPRGESIPPNKVIPRKDSYKRIKIDWKEFLIMEELDED